MSPNPDTIARLVSACADDLAAALGPHHRVSCVERYRQGLHHLAMEIAGGAAYARPEPSPQPVAPAAVAGWVVRAIPRDAVQPPAKQWLADLGGDPDGYALVATTEHIGCRFSERAQADEHAAAFERLHPDHVAAPLPLAEALRIDAAEHAKEQPAPAQPAGYVVRQTTALGWVRYDQQHGPAVSRLAEATRYSKPDADYAAADWRREAPGSGAVVEVLPVDAAGNVLEERAPAPRGPDGWVVVNDRGQCVGAWTRAEVDDPAQCAKRRAAERGSDWTARPFWLDAPPGPGVACEAARAGEEAARLRAEVERLTRERDEAREAVKAAEDRAEHWCNRAVRAEGLARKCRDVALGERERLTEWLRVTKLYVAFNILLDAPAPTLPEVP